MSLACLALKAAAEVPGQVDFGEFGPPSGGGEYVEVHLRSNLISMAARLVEREEPKIAELLRGLHSVRVNVIGLNEQNRADVKERVMKIRGDLAKQGWERLVTVQQKGEDVGVYLKTRGEEAVEGLVVTVLGGDGEAVFINVVGNIRPEQLAELGERLNIDPLKEIAPKLKEK